MTLLASDIQIDDSQAASLGTSLTIGNLQWPSVVLSNNALRFIYCAVDMLDSNGNTIGTMNYVGSPPSPFFRALDLIGSQTPLSASNAAAALIQLALVAQKEEFPLIQPYSRFRLRIVGPSWNNSVPFSQYLDGRWTSWAATIFFLWIGAVASAVKAWQPYQGELGDDSSSDAADPAAPSVNLQTTAGLISTSYDPIKVLIGKIEILLESVMGSTPTVATPKIAQGLWTIMAEPAVQTALAEVLGMITRVPLTPSTLLNAALAVFPETAWIGRILAFLNLTLMDLDFFQFNESGFYLIDIPSRRAPQFSCDVTTFSVAAGGRTALPLSILFPDGYRLRLDRDHFLAVISALPAQDGVQGFLFENVTVISGGQYEIRPLSFRLYIQNDPASSPAAWINPQGENTLPPDGAYDFSYGLKSFVQGLNEGSSMIQGELVLDPGSYPFGVGMDRDSYFAVSLNVTQAALNVAFAEHHSGAVTGCSLSLPLTVTYAFYPVFDARQPFTATISYGTDQSNILLDEITLDDGTVYPFTLICIADGTNSDGDPLIDFVPSTSLQYAMQAGPVALEQGLSSLIRVRDAGTTSITATVQLDQDQPPVTGSDSDTIEIDIGLGSTTASVTPDRLTFDDDLVQDVAVTVYLPDNSSWSTSVPITLVADITDDGTTLTLALSNVWYDLADGSNIESIADLLFELPSGGAFDFDSEDAFGASATPQTFYGPLQDFLKAVKNDSATLQITPAVAADSPINFKTTGTKVKLDVANPATPMLSEYYEIDRDGNRIGPHLCQDGQSFDLWRANTIEVHGQVSSATPQTTIASYLNNAATGNATLNTSNWSFVMTMTGLSVGENVIRIDADKPANFGHPQSASITLNGKSPTIQCLTPLPQSTFEEVILHLTGTYATSYGVSSQIGTGGASVSGRGAPDDPYLNMDTGTFDDPTFLAPTANIGGNGNNTVFFQVDNGLIRNVQTRLGNIDCLLPDVSFAINSSLVVPANPPQHISVTETTVRLHGGVTQVPANTQATIRWTTPGGVQHTTRANVPFDMNVDVPESGIYVFSVSATNVYGETTLTANVEQDRVVENWNVFYTLSVIPDPNLPDGVTQAIIVTTSSTSGGSVETGPASSVSGNLQYQIINNVLTGQSAVWQVFLIDEAGNPIPAPAGPVLISISGQVQVIVGTQQNIFAVCGALPPSDIVEVLVQVPLPASGQYPPGPGNVLEIYFFEAKISTASGPFVGLRIVPS